jgi:hypothetical protein
MILLCRFFIPKKDKYSVEYSKSSELFLPKNLPQHQAAFIRASLSTSSWNKHNSALNCFKDFQNSCGKIDCEFPLSDQTICDFVAVKKEFKVHHGAKLPVLLEFLS